MPEEVSVGKTAAPHQSTSDRLGVWLSTFVGSLVLSLVLGAPRWIPEWQSYIDGLVVCLMLAATAASIASFNAARRRFGHRVAPKWRGLASLFVGGLMFAVWSFGVLITAFAIGGGPFEASYSKQLHFAELDATIYLYDSSFLDPETAVYVRRGWLPLREQVMRLGKAPGDVQVTLRGNVLMIDGRALALQKRE